MSKTKKIISLLLTVALIMTMATVAIVSASAATTVYFTNNKGWENVYIHAWNDGGDLTTWPGNALTFVEMNGYGEPFFSAVVPDGATGIIFNGGEGQPQTVDITEGIVENNAFYPDQEVDGKWTVGTWTYVPTVVPTDAPTTAAPTEATTADEVPTEATAATTEATEATAATTEATEATAATTEATEATAATTEATEATTAAVTGETGIEVDGTVYQAAVGDTVTYTFDLTAARLFENIQATVTYDSSKLELVRHLSDDPDVEDWEVEGPIACPALDGVIFNAGIDGIVKLNASKVAGYNFKEGATLVTLEFVVKDTALSSIDTVIEEMTIKGGDESYFAGGEAVITEGLTTVETLVVPVPETSSTAATTEATEVTTAATEATVPTTGDVQPTTGDVQPTTGDVQPTTGDVQPTTGDVAPTASEPDASATVDTTADDADNGTVKTGAAAYIYVVLAVLTMAACAVVVLRKRANG